MQLNSKKVLGITLLLIIGILFVATNPNILQPQTTDEKTAVFYFDDYARYRLMIIGYPEGWIAPQYLVDGNTGTVAHAEAFRSEILISNTCPEDMKGVITKVELRANGATNGGIGANTIELQPMFISEGVTGWGEVWESPYWTVNVLKREWTPYYDITDDSNGPEVWNWDDVRNLDCRINSKRTYSGNAVSMVEIRVTYTEPTDEPEGTDTPITEPEPEQDQVQEPVQGGTEPIDTVPDKPTFSFDYTLTIGVVASIIALIIVAIYIEKKGK